MKGEVEKDVDQLLSGSLNALFRTCFMPDVLWSSSSRIFDYPCLCDLSDAEMKGVDRSESSTSKVEVKISRTCS